MTRSRREKILEPLQEMASPYNPDWEEPSTPAETVRRIDGMLPGDYDIYMARLDALREARAAVNGASEQMEIA